MHFDDHELHTVNMLNQMEQLILDLIVIVEEDFENELLNEVEKIIKLEAYDDVLKVIQDMRDHV